MRRLKIALATLIAGGALTLTGCATTYTFEAVPVGADEDTAENGLEGDPNTIECFIIEADASTDDADDEQLGEFCKVENPSDEALEQMEQEEDED